MKRDGERAGDAGDEKEMEAEKELELMHQKLMAFPVQHLLHSRFKKEQEQKIN